jgi:hypothetical protein
MSVQYKKSSQGCSHARVIVMYVLMAKCFVSSTLMFCVTDRLFHFPSTCLLVVKRNTIQYCSHAKRHLALRVNINPGFKKMFLMWLSCVYQGLSET